MTIAARFLLMQQSIFLDMVTVDSYTIQSNFSCTSKVNIVATLRFASVIMPVELLRESFGGS